MKLNLGVSHFILSHLIWVVAVVTLLLGFHSWQKEHDARLLATQEEKVAEAQVKTLQQSITDRDRQTTIATAPIVKIIHDVKTVPEVIGALPTVLNQPLPAPVIPEPPTGPQGSGIFIPEPDVLPIFDQVADDKVCRVQLDTAMKDLTDEKSIVGQRDNEITQLKKKPSFWARTKSTVKILGIGLGLGLALGSKL
jgi:hypothetical protein